MSHNHSPDDAVEVASLKNQSRIRHLSGILNTLRSRLDVWRTGADSYRSWTDAERGEFKILQGACELVHTLMRRSGGGSIYLPFEAGSNAMLFVEQGLCDEPSTDWYPLHWAVILGHRFKQDALLLIRERPALCRAATRHPSRFLPIHLLLSLRYPDISVLTELLRAYPDGVRDSIVYQHSSAISGDLFPVLPVMVAARWCQCATAMSVVLRSSSLLRTSYSPQSGGSREVTALHAACMNCFPPVFDMALEADPSAVSVPNERSRYPAHIAASFGNLHAVSVLTSSRYASSASGASVRYVLHEVLTNYFALISDAAARSLLDAVLATEAGRADVLRRQLDDRDAEGRSRLPVNLAARYSSQSTLLHLVERLSDGGLVTLSGGSGGTDVGSSACCDLDELLVDMRHNPLLQASDYDALLVRVTSGLGEADGANESESAMGAKSIASAPMEGCEL